MGNIVFSQAAKFLKKRRNTRRWIAVVLCLALIVTSGTFGALTRHGSALTGAEQVLACTYENHVHGEECYNEAGELVCGYADYCVHVHNESCYDSEDNLICPLPEIEAHVHDESCYVDEEQLVCGMEENEIHQHTDDCYDIELGDLVCELEEHVHDDSCYELITEEDEIPENGTDADGENTQGEAPDGSEAPIQSETPAASEEPAENDNTAQSEAPAASQTPAQSEAPAASQEPEQSEAPAVSAEPGQSGEPAASQTPEQSAEPSASGEAAQSEEPAEAVQSAEPAEDTETAQTGETAESTEAQQGETPAESTESSDGGEINECAESRRLICGMEEHTHGNECYNQNKVLKCGKKEESVPHVHSDECYELKHVAKCGKLELHTHSEECYTDGVLTCGKLELKEHVHTEECFREAPVMELTATAGDATITVSANEEGIIPAGAELSVTPVVKTETDTLDNLESEEERAEAEALNAVYDEIQQGLEASVEEDDTKEIKHFLAYDISFHTQNENGETEEVKLNGDVNVTLEFPQGALPEEIISDENTQIESVDVLDVKATEEGRVAETQDAVVNTTQDTDVEKIETTLSDSSTLAIAWIGEINPDGKYVYEDDDVVITVTPVDEGAIPENAKLQVIPIIASEETGEQYQQVAEKLLEKAESKEYEIAGFLAYDISFVDEAGNKIEPNGEVKVAMNYKEAKIPAEVDAATYAFAAEETDTETDTEQKLDVKVMHLEESEEGSVNVVDMAEQQKVTALETTEEQKIQNAEFVTDGFSVYTITWTWDTSKPCVYEDEDVIITITAIDANAIPEGTSVSVTPIKADDPERAEQYQEVARKLMEKAAEENYDVTGFLAYDISLVVEGGAEIEPNGKVKVTMEYKRPMAVVEIDPTVYALVSQELGLTEQETVADTETTTAESTEDGTEVPPAEDVSEATEGTSDDAEQIAYEADETEGDDSKAETEQYEITVVHLEEDDQGEVTQVVDMAEAGQVQAIEKNEQQEVCKAEFVTDSFSRFVLTWSEDRTTIETDKEIEVVSIMSQFDLSADKNKWQIVDNKYTDNGINDKDAWPKSTPGNPVAPDVRVQKNVIPTDVENEFLVYLSIDMKSVFESYFMYDRFEATPSNNYGRDDLGEIKSSMTGNQKVDVTTEAKYDKHASLTIKDHTGKIIADKLELYWSNGNNGTFYYKTSSGYILMGLSVKSGTTNNEVRLSKDAEDAIREDITTDIKLGTVTDIMGDYIEFQGIVAGDYSEDERPSFNGNVLTWKPVPKKDAAVDTVTETDNKGNKKTETWSLNVAELLYKVRLKVEQDGFHSCADNMDSKVEEDESYEVNQSAVLTYDKGTAIFQKPHVRGLLYDFALMKKAKDEKGKDLGPLPGAIFQTEDRYGNVYTATSRRPDGAVRFVGLPWGTYTVEETGVPSGYEGVAIDPITLCYTEQQSNLQQNSGNLVDMIHNDYVIPEASDEGDVIVGNGSEGSDTEGNPDAGNDEGIVEAETPKNVVYNIKKYVSVEVTKEWVDGNNALGTRPSDPSEIEITLKYRKEGSADEVKWENFTDENHPNAVYKILANKDWKLTIENLPTGNEYCVVETPVDGYTTSYIPEKTSYNKTDLVIRNVLQTQIIKRSSSSDELTLPGATFALTGEGVDWIGTSSADGTVEWIIRVEETKAEETEAEETKAVSMDDLPDGSYQLTETSAPTGYACSEAIWTITVQGGLVTSITASDSTGSASTLAGVKDNNNNKQTFYFENSPSYALPSTGGEGIYWYSIGGMLMMCAAVLILYRNKNKIVRGCRRA